MKIIFLSHTARNSIYKVGSYHLSNKLSEEHELLYINNPLTTFHGIKALLNSKYRKYVFKNKLKNFGLKREKKIINFSPFKIITFRIGFPFEFTSWATSSTFIENLFLKNILKKKSFLKADIVIIDNLILSYFTDIIDYKKLIYRATDDYTSLPNQSKKLEIIERKLINKSDKVVVTSSVLKKIFKKKYNVTSKVIHNGIDTLLLSSLKTEIPKLYSTNLSNYKLIAVYIGSLDSRIDKELLRVISINNPSIAIVLGGDTNGEFRDYTNIYEIGKVPYEDIGRYYANANIGLLPFNVDHVGNKTRSPMKLYEMLFFGITVISTDFEEIRNRKEKNLIICKNKIDFQRTMSNISSLKFSKESIDFLKHDWKEKSKKLISGI